MTPEQLAYFAVGLFYGSTLGYAAACALHGWWSGALGGFFGAIALTVAIRTGALSWAILWLVEVLP